MPVHYIFNSIPCFWPKIVIRPYIIVDPLICFIVLIWWTCCGPIHSLIQHHDLLSELNLFIFISLLNITRFQSSIVQFLYHWANLKHARTYLQFKCRFFCCIWAPNLASLQSYLIVMSDNNYLFHNKVVLLFEMQFQVNFQ